MTALFHDLVTTVAECRAHVGSLPESRRRGLERLGAFVRGHDPARLVFICTHNSRRSHMAQLWACVAAAITERDHVQSYSGGTEATAFAPPAVEAMRRAGFEIASEDHASNPRYRVRIGPDAEPLEVFSKRFDQPPNPREDFAAVMVCSDADANCPVVPGAIERIALPFDDPKEADGTDHEAVTYDARVREIGAAILYAFTRV
jgi:protein-tyrosine-phosphatase